MQIKNCFKKKALLIKIAINIVLEEQINEFSCHKMSQNTVIIITNLTTQIVCYAMKRAKHENLASLTGSPVEIHLKTCALSHAWTCFVVHHTQM